MPTKVWEGNEVTRKWGVSPDKFSSNANIDMFDNNPCLC